MFNQRKWITLKELVHRKGITTLEILDLMKEGRLQAYYSTWGQRIIDSDPLEKTRRDSLEKMIWLVRLEEGKKAPGYDIISRGKTVTIGNKPRTGEQIKQAAKENYEAQPLDKIILPKNCENCFPISFSKPTKREIEILQNAVFKAEDIEEFEKQRTLEKPTKSEKDVFPCEPGTNWDEIFITLVADDMVRIRTPKGEGRVTYHTLKMFDIRKGDSPIMIWELLKLFAKNDGFISSMNTKYDPRLPDTAKRLNKHLKELFGINESIYKAHYKKEKGYRTKIHFSDQTIVAD